VTLALTVNSNPTGLTIAGNGTNTITVSGTPTSGGTVSFTVTASDAYGTRTPIVYSFTVAPAVTLTGPTMLLEDEVGFAYTPTTITPTGGTGTVTLALTVNSNPTGLMITGDGTNTITVSGTPTSAGTVSFTVTPTDRFGSITGTVYTLTVAPSVTVTPISLPAGQVGSAYSRLITSTGGIGSVRLAVTGVTNNTGLTIFGDGTGIITVSGTPTSAGTLSFTVTPTDTLGQQTGQMYSITVAPAPVSPPPAPAPATAPAPFYTSAVVFGNLLILQGINGLQVLPVPRGSFAFMEDVNGDGTSDVVLVQPNLILAINGSTGSPLFILANGQLIRF
jgi:hypothetical protein